MPRASVLTPAYPTRPTALRQEPATACERVKVLTVLQVLHTSDIPLFVHLIIALVRFRGYSIYSVFSPWICVFLFSRMRLR
jgi:hypothetical protein